MQREIFEVMQERFHLLDPTKYILQGKWPKEYEVEAWLDDVLLGGTIEEWEFISALERFENLDQMQGKRVTVTLNLPKNLASFKRLTIYASRGKDRIRWFRISAKALAKRQGTPQFYIEEEKVRRTENRCQIRGWVTADKPVELWVYDETGKSMEYDIQMTNRADVVKLFKETEIDPRCGFFVEVKHIDSKVVYLEFRTADSKVSYPIDQRRLFILKKKISHYVKKGVRYLRVHGVSAFVGKVFQKLNRAKYAPVEYAKWLPKHLPDEYELNKQRNTKFEYHPKFSIVVPLYKTPVVYLEKMVESVKKQTYDNWELCLSDGSGIDSPLKNTLEKMAAQDGRIRVIYHEKPLQISENTNAAIEIATGDYIVFMDHDDELTAHALFECVKALNKDPSIDVLYSDEDKMTMDGNRFFQPHFKPDFNIDLLCSVNYICHLFVVRRTLIDEVGMLRREYDGAQDYDFIFRCVEATDKICHIPKILYHWRCHEDSTSENPESKLYAFEAGKRVVQGHYDRQGIGATVEKGEHLGLYRTKYKLDEQPLISILIPNKDHIDDLKRCIDSIEQKSSYKNYEYIIIENNSTEPETFAWYKKLESVNEKVKVVYYEGNFNYSKINNFGAAQASGEYLLLLNNDTEIINEDCVEELLGYCSRADVGIVGARMYYEDDTIQHAGVVIGFGGIAGHCFVMQPRDATGYCHRIICAQNYSAVTAACLMVKKSVFDEVGGLTEALAVAFNDIDFCLKVRKAGYLVVYNPYAELYHYESKSRGLEDTSEKVARFNQEIADFEKRWPDILKNGDPYYNPNLTLDSQDFSLKRI